MGDARTWLSKLNDVSMDMIVGGIEIEPATGVLAEEYLSVCRSSGAPLPGDFDDSNNGKAVEQREKQAITQEFVTFLRAWRERYERARRVANTPP